MSDSFTAFDRRMMERALELARRGLYTNHPNPRVGCVIVQGERIVGEGWHRKWGEPHAEVNALREAGDAARGGDVYVTLEPHSYHGRTPPCTEALIRAGVRRVVCGALDPNPKVLGNGVQQLRAAGVIVHSGLLETEVRALNEGFEKRMTRGLPRLIVKIAASLDGRVALANGASRWITGDAARADVQRLRAEVSAIVTGVDTVLADDPHLNVRDPQIETLGRQPLRVVLDSKLRTPASARLLTIPGETLIFTTVEPPASAALGAKIVPTAVSREGRVDVKAVLSELAARHCNDVLVEAGPTLSGAFLEQGLVDELILYVAPMLLGPDARAMAMLPVLHRLEDAHRYTLSASERIGADIKLTLRPRE